MINLFKDFNHSFDIINLGDRLICEDKTNTLEFTKFLNMNSKGTLNDFENLN